MFNWSSLSMYFSYVPSIIFSFFNHPLFLNLLFKQILIQYASFVSLVVMLVCFCRLAPGAEPLLLRRTRPGGRAARAGAARDHGVRRRARPAAGPAVRDLVERFDRRGTEPVELFTSEFGQNSWNRKKTTVRILSKFRNFR